MTNIPKTRKANRRPVAPWMPCMVALASVGGLVALIASQFTFDPIGRQIAWIGSSFTLTATCIAYVVQSGRCTAWDEAHYEAVRRRIAGHDGHRVGSNSS